MTKEAGVSRLLHMAGVDSIINGMDWEQKRADAWARESHDTIWGEGKSTAPEEEDDMRVMVAGDLVNNHPATKQQQAVSQRVEAKEKAPSKLAAAAIVASTVIGGGLAGAALTNAITTAPATYEDTDTRYEFGIGMPQQNPKER